LVSLANISCIDFERFEMNGGGTIVDLDFQGDYESGQHNVSVVAAGSEQRITLPADAGEHMEVVSIATPVIVTGIGWEKNALIYKNFTTDDYDTTHNCGAGFTRVIFSTFDDPYPVCSFEDGLH
jgi:hypothetical protein